MIDSAYRKAWEVPDCPGCGGHLFVWRAGTYDWVCYAPGCKTYFDAPDPVETENRETFRAKQ
jgi:hypothetical protein